MSVLMRRRLLLRAAWVGAGAALARTGLAQDEVQPRVIELLAKRFTYVPSEIALKAGERVVIAIKAVDFAHGMNIPDLGKRLDLVPGRVIELELQPAAAGTIEFMCDNFCGDGHEEMQGRFVVTA